MACLDKPDLAVRAVERAEDAVDAVSGIPEDVAHAPLLQGPIRKSPTVSDMEPLTVDRTRTQTAGPRDGSRKIDPAAVRIMPPRH
jgi:hypothetical protein